MAKVGYFSMPLEYKFEYEPITMTRERVGKNFAASKSADSDTIIVTFTHESPAMAVKYINDITDIYIDKKNSIISYDIINNRKINEIKNAHKEYITYLRYYLDNINNRDLFISISYINNNIKLWNINYIAFNQYT